MYYFFELYICNHISYFKIIIYMPRGKTQTRKKKTASSKKKSKSIKHMNIEPTPLSDIPQIQLNDIESSRDYPNEIQVSPGNIGNLFKNKIDISKSTPWDCSTVVKKYTDEKGTHQINTTTCLCNSIDCLGSTNPNSLFKGLFKGLIGGAPKIINTTKSATKRRKSSTISIINSPDVLPVEYEPILVPPTDPITSDVVKPIDILAISKIPKRPSIGKNKTSNTKKRLEQV